MLRVNENTLLHSTPWVNKQDSKLLPITSPNVNRLSEFVFAVGLTGKFATNSYLNIPPHLKYVATLPCEMWMSISWRQSEICDVINDKSQGNRIRPRPIIWHRSSVGVASQWPCVRLQWFIHLQSHGLRKGDEHPAYTPRGVWHSFTFTYSKKN